MNDEKCSTQARIEKQSQVDGKMQLLSESLQGVEDSILDLSQRVENILSEPDPPKDRESREKEPLVPLAEAIASFHSRSMSIHGKIIDLIKRIEL